MLDFIGNIGPNTWAVLWLYLVLLLSLAGLARGGVLAILGVIGTVGSSAVLARIIFYRGSRDPVLHLPVALTTILVVMVALGISFIANRNAEASSSGVGLRSRVPQLDRRAIAATAIGLILVLAAGSVIVSRVDLPANHANKGFKVASKDFSHQATRTLRVVERFLAR